MSLDYVTRLLRTGDPGLVEADLVELLVTGEAEWLKDERDLMMALAPHHDCARRRAPTSLRSSIAQQPLARPASVSWSRCSAGAQT